MKVYLAFIFLGLLIISGCIQTNQPEHEQVFVKCSNPENDLDSKLHACIDDCEILGENYECNSNCNCVEIKEEPKLPVCGDSILDDGEDCETVADCSNNFYCNSNCECVRQEICGDGFVVGSEQCETDLGCNQNETCNECNCVEVGVNVIEQPDPTCGNGLMEENEQCEFQPQCGGDGVCIDCKCRDYSIVKPQCYTEDLEVLVGVLDECLIDGCNSVDCN